MRWAEEGHAAQIGSSVSHFGAEGEIMGATSGQELDWDSEIGGNDAVAADTRLSVSSEPWTKAHHERLTGDSTTPAVKVDLRRYRELRRSGIPDDEAELIVMEELAELRSWEPPVPFSQAETPVFPSDTLPNWLRDFVIAEAVATQTPEDLPAMLALGALAAIAAKKVIICVRTGWIEPLNLFVAVVLPPATRKSQVVKDVTRPLDDWEEQEARWVEPQIAEATNRHRIMDYQLRAVQTKAAKADDPSKRRELMEEATDLAQTLASIDIPVPPRLLADDSTPERLQTLIRDHDGRMAVISAEGGDCFDMMSGRYQKEANLGIYLKGHAGDTVRVDRVGRPPEYIRNPALTLALAIQPDVLRGLFGRSGFRGRGLLGRFLFSIPESLVGRRDINPPPVPAEIRQTYESKIGDLLNLAWGTDDHGNKCAHVLRLDDEATNRFNTFMARIEPQLSENGELGALTDWGGKLAGAVARIAGLLHLGDRAGDPSPWDRPIGRHVIERAIRIGEYSIEHARAAYAEMGADPVVEDARHILQTITKKVLVRFTKQEIWQLTKGRFEKVDGLDAALEALVERGYLREFVRETEPGKRGRKPAPSYLVNPLI